MKVKNKLIVGHYGSGNFGDDIMLKSLVDKENFISRPFNVLVYGDKISGFGIDEDRFIKIDRSKKLSHLFVLFKQLLISDEVIWGGGTCFTDEEGDGYFNAMFLALLMRRKVSYRAIGLGTLERFSRKIKLKILLYMGANLTARDHDSISRIKNFSSKLKDVSFEEDLGKTYLSKIKAEIKLSDDIDLLVAWRDLSNYGIYGVKEVSKYIKEKAALINASKVVLIDVDDMVDADFNRDLSRELSEIGVAHEYIKNITFVEKLNFVSRSRLIMTARLHVMMAGLELGKKVEVFPYSKKINYELKSWRSDYKIINPYEGRRG